MSGIYTFTFSKPGYFFTRGGSLFYRYYLTTAFPPGPVDERLSVVYAAPTTLGKWATVSAADYATGITNEMILAGFGSGIAATTATASLPLPTTMGARKIVVRDPTGKEAAARFLFISPNQINFVMPNGLAEGACVVQLLDSADNVRFVDMLLLYANRPSLFTANADGKDVPAAFIVRVKPGDIQSLELVAEYDQQLKKWVPKPIDLGPESERVFLVLYGTGWRNYTASNSPPVVMLAGEHAEVTYVGSQRELAGLDQINAQIPRTLIGRGDVNLVLSFIDSNLLTWPLKMK